MVGKMIVLYLVTTLVVVCGGTTYNLITGTTCSSSSAYIYDTTGTIYGASSDYTTAAPYMSSCTKTFQASSSDHTITVALITTDFCPYNNDVLEIYDSSTTLLSPARTINRFTTSMTFTSTSRYLTLKLTTSRSCSLSYRGFRLTYTVNSGSDWSYINDISQAFTLGVGAIVGIVIAVITVIVLSIVGCICCCIAAGNSRGRTNATTVVQAAQPAPYPGGQGYAVTTTTAGYSPGYAQPPPYTGGMHNPGYKDGGDNMRY